MVALTRCVLNKVLGAMSFARRHSYYSSIYYIHSRVYNVRYMLVTFSLNFPILHIYPIQITVCEQFSPTKMRVFSAMHNQNMVYVYY